MTNNRTYTGTQTRYDADSDVDSEQMTHYDPIAELNAQSAAHAATRQQLAEAMALCAQLSAERDELCHLRDAWKAEAMEARAERAQLIVERDEARRTADEAVSAIAVVQTQLHGLGWYC